MSTDSMPGDTTTAGSDTDVQETTGPSAAEAAVETAPAGPADGGGSDGEGSGDEGSGDEGSGDEGDAPLTGEALLVREGDIAADYLERLLDILDYDGDIDLDVEGERAVVAVVGGSLRGLIGPGGATLDALQEMTRLAVAQQTGVRTRLMLDVGGYRAKRREELTELARSTAAAVKESGERRKLAPMNPFERKVVHDAVSAADGVVSESEGEEPNRCVVVLPQA